MRVTKPAPDPFHYRWFSVSGILIAAGQKIMIAQGAHADDLAEGEAGKAEMAERVRQHYAELYNDPEARWEDLMISETPPEDGYFDIRFPFEPPKAEDDRRSIFEVDLGNRSKEGDD